MNKKKLENIAIGLAFIITGLIFYHYKITHYSLTTLDINITTAHLTGWYGLVIFGSVILLYQINFKKIRELNNA